MGDTFGCDWRRSSERLHTACLERAAFLDFDRQVAPQVLVSLGTEASESLEQAVYCGPVMCAALC